MKDYPILMYLYAGMTGISNTLIYINNKFIPVVALISMLFLIKILKKL